MIKIIKSICRRIFDVERRIKELEIENVTDSPATSTEVFLTNKYKNSLTDELSYLNYLLTKLINNENSNLNP